MGIPPVLMVLVFLLQGTSSNVTESGEDVFIVGTTIPEGTSAIPITERNFYETELRALDKPSKPFLFPFINNVKSTDHHRLQNAGAFQRILEIFEISKPAVKTTMPKFPDRISFGSLLEDSKHKVEVPTSKLHPVVSVIPAVQAKPLHKPLLPVVFKQPAVKVIPKPQVKVLPLVKPIPIIKPIVKVMPKPQVKVVPLVKPVPIIKPLLVTPSPKPVNNQIYVAKVTTISKPLVQATPWQKVDFVSVLSPKAAPVEKPIPVVKPVFQVIPKPEIKVVPVLKPMPVIKPVVIKPLAEVIPKPEIKVVPLIKPIPLIKPVAKVIPEPEIKVVPVVPMPAIKPVLVKPSQKPVSNHVQIVKVITMSKPLVPSKPLQKADFTIPVLTKPAPIAKPLPVPKPVVKVIRKPEMKVVPIVKPMPVIKPVVVKPVAMPKPVIKVVPIVKPMPVIKPVEIPKPVIKLVPVAKPMPVVKHVLVKPSAKPVSKHIQIIEVISMTKPLQKPDFTIPALPKPVPIVKPIPVMIKPVEVMSKPEMKVVPLVKPLMVKPVSFMAPNPVSVAMPIEKRPEALKTNGGSDTFISKIGGVFSGTVDGTKMFFSKAQNVAKTARDNMLNKTSNLVDNFRNAASNAQKTIVAVIVKPMANGASKVVEGAKETFQPIATGVNNAATETVKIVFIPVHDGVFSLADQVKAAFEEKRRLLQEIMENKSRLLAEHLRRKNELLMNKMAQMAIKTRLVQSAHSGHQFPHHSNQAMTKVKIFAASSDHGHQGSLVNQGHHLPEHAAFLAPHTNIDPSLHVVMETAAPLCGIGEVYLECGSSCTRTCLTLNKPIVCSLECKPGCYCRPGLFYSTLKKKCVSHALCKLLRK